MERKSRLTALALSCVALMTMGLTTAQAATDPSPTQQPQPSDESPAVTPEFTSEEEQFLAGEGVDGEITAQTDAGGATMYLDGEGDWVITPPSDPDTGVSPMWSAGWCAGTFYLPVKINNTLEWGAQNDCESSPPNAVFPHYIDVLLRDTCQGFPCGVYEDLWTDRSTNGRYDSVATVSEAAVCEASDDRNYDLKVTVYVAGTRFGPFNSVPADVDGCHVHPAPGGVG